jgi:hypothetical protein
VTDAVVEQTRKWIEEVVIGCNFCPFAARELKADSIHFRVELSPHSELLRQAVLDEFVWLDEHRETETSLVLFPNALADFEDYLDFVAVAERLLVRHRYRSVYQLASFHPQYRFADSSDQDAANYTNRSLYPMLHILREDSMERALDRYPDPDKIPTRNIEFARSRGVVYFEQLRDACKRPLG